MLHLLRLLPFLFGGHRQIALENLALRQQLAAYKRIAPRPRLRPFDRLFWVGLARVWTGWREALVIVSPDTVLRWQRRRFRAYWAKLSGRPTRGRPCIPAEIAALVKKMAAANPLWGAPRIHGELLKLGIEVGERTVSRLMPKRRPQPSQTWRTFLVNHVRDLVSIDFFTVPTAGLRVLFVLVVLAHHRRRVVGQYFRHRVKGMRIKGSPHGVAQPLAKPFRRAPDRFDPARVPESCRRPRRAPSTPPSDRVLQVLPPGPHASLARQGCPRRPVNRATGARPDHHDS